MRTLVTGGAGFIGSHLVEGLLAHGNEVIILDNLSTGVYENLASVKDRITFIKGSILDLDVLEECIGQVDEVYHLAAAVGVKRVLQEPLMTLESNAIGTYHLLTVASKYRKRVLIASSSEVYGNLKGEYVSEEHERIYGPTIQSRWVYAESKAIGESFALAFAKQLGLEVTIVRLFNVVGPRQRYEFGMVLPAFIQQACLGMPITVYGSGTQQRSFIHVKEVIAPMMTLMEEGSITGEIFNIAGRNEISIIELAKRVRMLTNSNSDIVMMPYQEAYPSGFEEIYKRSPNTSKLCSRIAFNPVITLDEIIVELASYYKNQWISLQSHG